MAKIKAPLFSLDVTGTLDKNITYKGLKQKHIAQKYSQPGAKNPFESSPRQKDQRSIIRLITIHWQCMSSADKLSWETAAKDVRFKGTGYHYFLHMAQQNLTQYLGLVGYWSMNYNIDDKIPDLSGNGNDGTLSPIYPCDSPTLVDSIDKKQGKAAYFDGINDQIIVPFPSSFDFGTGPFTVFCMFKSPPGSLGGLITKYSGWLNAHFFTEIRVNKVYYSICDASGNKTSHGGLTTVNDDIWHFACFIRDPSTGFVYLYIDGVLDLAPKVDITGSITSYSNLLFGKRSANYLSGLLDNILIYNYAISETEYLKLYQYFKS